MVDETGNYLKPWTRQFTGQNGDFRFPALMHEMGIRNVLAESSLIHEVGLFDESLVVYEDWDFYLRVAMRATIVWVPRQTVNYRLHDQGLTRGFDHIPRLRALRKVYEKHQHLVEDLPPAQQVYVRKKRRGEFATLYRLIAKQERAKRRPLSAAFNWFLSLLYDSPSRSAGN